MTAAEDWLRARGIVKLQLMVRGDNATVHAFYESLGYYDQKRVTFAKWLDGRDPTIMSAAKLCASSHDHRHDLHPRQGRPPALRQSLYTLKTTTLEWRRADGE